MQQGRWEIHTTFRNQNNKTRWALCSACCAWDRVFRPNNNPDASVREHQPPVIATGVFPPVIATGVFPPPLRQEPGKPFWSQCSLLPDMDP